MSSSVDKSTEQDDTQRSRLLEGHNNSNNLFDVACNPSPIRDASAGGTQRRNNSGDDRGDDEVDLPQDGEVEGEEEEDNDDHDVGDDDDDNDDNDDDDEGDDNEDKDEPQHHHESGSLPNAMQLPPQQYGYGAAPHYHGGYYMGYGPPPPSGPPSSGPPHPDYGLTSPIHPFSYTDASQMSDPTPDTRRNRGGVTEPFPEKLHRMLDAAEREGLSDVVSFFPHGRAFAIHKPRRFVSEIMPRFFRQSRLTSFQRQLNLYGFRRISQGPDNGGYYHELFLKGRAGLCVNMKRTKVKGVQKLKRDPETEPNFYSFPPIKSTPHISSAPPPPLPSSSSSSGQPTPTRTPPGQNAVTTPVSPAPPPPFYPPPYPPMPYYGQFQPPPPYTAAQQNAPVYPYQPYYGYPWGYPPPPPPIPPQQHTPPQQQQQQPQHHHLHHLHHSGATPQGTPETTPIKSEGDHTPIPPTIAVKDEDKDEFAHSAQV